METPNIYETIIEILVDAKKEGNKDYCIKALVQSLDLLINLVKNKSSNYDCFSSFIADQKLLLPKDENAYMQDGADYHLSTGGLLSDVAYLAGLNEPVIFASKIQDLIFDAHAEMVSHKSEVRSILDKFAENIESLKQEITQN